MSDRLFIGIDNGTQGTKCAVFSEAKGEIIASAYAKHDLIENDEGRREQDPAWWIDAARETLSACLATPGVDRSAVVAIGVSGQQHGFVALDAAGDVLRPAKLWCDTETVPQCETITARAGGPEAVVDAIGNAVAAGFTASKILWMAEHEPANYERLATVLLPHDHVNFWLTGERKMECGDASGTALFDVRSRTWSQKLVDAVDPSGKLASCLPPVIAADEAVGTIRPEIAAGFGLPASVIVSAGGGDNMMGAIGTGNVADGIVTTSLGTSGTIYSRSSFPVIDPAGELAAFCSSDGGWLPLICTMNVTVATELTRALFGSDLQAFDAMVEAAPPGAGGLLLLPYFNGERTPPLPRARASFHGITSTNCTRANFARAAMEGATFGLRYGLELLRRLGVDAKEIRLVGGGSKSRIWRSIVADIFGCPVVCPASAEAGAMGGVLQAMWCVARQSDRSASIADLSARFIRLDDASRVEPDAATMACSDEAYARYLAIHDALAPLQK
jgi:xylulokinase